MAETEFKLPSSSLTEIKKLMIAYAKSKNASSLTDLAKLTGINKTIISSNNGFLESINAIGGGNSKEATSVGKKLGLAFANSIESEIELNSRQLLESNEFILSMTTALEIKPRSVEDFQSHIAYSLGKELKGRFLTGTGTLVEMLKMAGIIEEKDGLLYPKNNIAPLSTAQAKINQPTATEEVGAEVTPLISKKIVNGLGNSVTLNINIQLTIPETENEVVYDSFFQAMKKHLLS
jgi:hypothetical protein